MRKQNVNDAMYILETQTYDNRHNNRAFCFRCCPEVLIHHQLAHFEHAGEQSCGSCVISQHDDVAHCTSTCIWFLITYRCRRNPQRCLGMTRKASQASTDRYCPVRMTILMIRRHYCADNITARRMCIFTLIDSLHPPDIPPRARLGLLYEGIRFDNFESKTL